MRKCNFFDDLLNEIFELDNQVSPATGCFDSSQSPAETQVNIQILYGFMCIF